MSIWTWVITTASSPVTHLSSLLSETSFKKVATKCFHPKFNINLFLYPFSSFQKYFFYSPKLPISFSFLNPHTTWISRILQKPDSHWGTLESKFIQSSPFLTRYVFSSPKSSEMKDTKLKDFFCFMISIGLATSNVGQQFLWQSQQSPLCKWVAFPTRFLLNRFTHPQWTGSRIQQCSPGTGKLAGS